MSMSARLTTPFIENGTLSRPFFQALPPKVIAMKIRSRVTPQLNRRQVGVGLLRTVSPVQFEVDNEEHRKAWATFYVSGKWTMHFILEQPWDSVPQMIQDKMLAQLAADIGPTAVAPAPIKLVNDEVVDNVPELDGPPVFSKASLSEVTTLTGDVYYKVATDNDTPRKT